MAFDAKKCKAQLIEFIQNWFEVNGKDCKAVVGISGGKDSTIVAGLCAEALGKDRVFGVLMPNGVQKDISDSKRVVECLGIPYAVVNIEDAFQAMMKNASCVVNAQGKDITKQTLQNLPPRLRMATLYSISQSINGRVINTTNASEKFIGWGTMWGDTVGDVGLLRNLTVQEVMAVGDELDIPRELIHKVPADGLTDCSDEDNFGFTYAALDKYIRTGECEDEEVKAKIERMHRNSEFKRNPIVAFEYNE